jgi:hypothetical protein
MAAIVVIAAPLSAAELGTDVLSRPETDTTA